MTAAAFLAERPRLGGFWTPLVVLDDKAMRSDVATMARMVPRARNASWPPTRCGWRASRAARAA